MPAEPTIEQKQIIDQKIHQVLVGTSGGPNAATEYQNFRSANQTFQGLDAAMHIKYNVPKGQPLQYDTFRNSANPGEAETDRDNYYGSKQRSDAQHMALAYKAGSLLGISREQIDSAEGPAPKDPTAATNIINEVISRAEKNISLPPDAHLAAAPRPPARPAKGNSR